MAIGILGAGRVGQALGRLLAAHHEIVVASPNHAAEATRFIGPRARAVTQAEITRHCETLVVAVPDRAISEVANGLDRGDLNVALHTCGSLGPSALSPLAERGVSCGMFHPLQTFATPEKGVEALRGAAFGICASGRALSVALELTVQLGGEPLVIKEHHLGSYHAAASLGGNATIAVIDAAVMLMGLAGVPSDRATKALAPLVRASAENALKLGPVEALTGPIERGDSGTIERHLASINMGAESVEALYRATARHLLNMAVRKGMPAGQAEAIEAILASND